MRRWLIFASFGATGTSLLFFICAPALGYPLEPPASLRLLQLTVPVFSGYLGSMTAFVLSGRARYASPPAETSRYLPLIVKGPVLIFTIGMIASIITFGFANRLAAAPGTGMSVDSLSTSITLCLGILTVTTGAVVAYLFRSGVPHAGDKRSG
jgi:hypothetical protein